MVLTVQQVESVMASRCGGWMGRCGLSTSATGANPDLADPIASALRALHLATPGAVPADADLQAVGDNDQDLYLGVVQLYTLRACMGRWAKVDQTVSLAGQKLDQLFQQLKIAHDTLAADLLARYGFGKKRKRNPKVGRIAAGNTWPPLPPPPSSAPPWPEGSTPAPGPQPSSGVVQWGFNP